MTITIRQKALANDNISLYLDIYDGGKRKFEFLSLYLLPEVDAETKARNEETLQRAHQIRAERILHPETIPEVGHLMIVKEIPNDESPEVLDWIDLLRVNDIQNQFGIHITTDTAHADIRISILGRLLEIGDCLYRVPVIDRIASSVK